ncbi:MAG: hypothetical protein JWL76_2160 [Thermoleophilia bacterium]|nr:hypothetical protein [Thermoleophilia bacterium]
MVRDPAPFRRIELPAVPAFPRPMVPADELPVQRPLLDAPTTGWQSPFPAPEATNSYTFQVVPPPPPTEWAPPLDPPQPHQIPRSAHATFCAMPSAAPAPAPAPAFSGVPALAPAPASASASASAPARATVLTQDGDVPAVDAPADVSMVAVGLLLATAALLMWASRMAFSPALLAMAALLLTEVGIALSRTGPKRPTPALVAVAAAAAIALLALKDAFAGFGEMAFVASLFVLVAALPTLLLLGALEFVLRKRSSASPANDALRSGTMLRFGAALALLVSGFLAKDSFSAKPDTFAALAIIALVGFGIAQVLRGTGRAARD